MNAAPDFGKMAVSRTNYSGQQGSCCPLLIFVLIDFLFIEGTVLYYMPPPAIETNITYSGYIMNPKTALDSFH